MAVYMLLADTVDEPLQTIGMESTDSLRYRTQRTLNHHRRQYGPRMAQRSCYSLALNFI